MGERASTGAATDLALHVLRHRWRVASLATGWRFPSDWPIPEVDDVCSSILEGSDVTDALAKLGRARAAAGAGLPETLSDLAALHAVLVEPDAEQPERLVDADTMPSRLLRVTALAWADAALEPIHNAEVTDPLTGLTTTAYLRTRLGEMYRRAQHDHRILDADYALLTVSLGAGVASGWSRLTSMVLVADVVRGVFDSGETLAVLGASTVVVLAERGDELGTKAVLVRRLINERASADPALRAVSQPRIRLARLPATHERACEMLARLSG
ncbi:MAG: hypothetical protein GEU98_08820 [Pseudonocardiaceae bacterium]|nr:hypothetical protein [Pseudonocardiaceae bacterium]